MKARAKLVTGMSIVVATITALVVSASDGPKQPEQAGGDVIKAPVALPVQSQDRLLEYALPRVVRGEISMWASGAVQIPGKESSAQVSGKGCEDVIDKLLAKELVIGLANPKDQVNVHFWLFNADGDILFYGRTSYKVGETPTYSVWMQSIPIMNGVSYANILILNEAGETVRNQSVEVKEGKLFFAPWYSGAVNGILSVRLVDRTTVTYRLSDPIAEIPAVVSGDESSWKIPGHYVFDRKSRTTVIPITEVYNRPTVFLRGMKTGDEIILDIQGIIDPNTWKSERPYEVIFSDVDGNETGIGKMFSDQPTTVTIESPGSVRLKFGWKEFQPGQRIWSGPVDEGGGKG